MKHSTAGFAVVNARCTAELPVIGPDNVLHYF